MKSRGQRGGQRGFHNQRGRGWSQSARGSQLPVSQNTRDGPGKRFNNIANVPSISRSGGADDDALKDRRVQEDYWEFIKTKVENHKNASYKSPSEKSEGQSNILIFLRRLREGIIASKRDDIFAIQVYETSLFLSVAFRSPVQTTAVIAHLNHLYSLRAKNSSLAEADEIMKRATTSSIICLLHFLVEGYPSHNAYFGHLVKLPTCCLDRESVVFQWITRLRSALSSGNYSKLDQLTSKSEMDQLVVLSHPDYRPELPDEAVLALVTALRSKMREWTWMVVRGAYRELSTNPDASWLGRTLMLPSAEVGDWVGKRSKEGQLREKEGVAGRWIILKG